jgi:uncharacterized protein (TIGR03382 family)
MSPSAASCPPGLTYEGCCDTEGRVIYCDEGELFCIDCKQNEDAADQVCGWLDEYYECGGSGEDPAGKNPMQCKAAPSEDTGPVAPDAGGSETSVAADVGPSGETVAADAGTAVETTAPAPSGGGGSARKDSGCSAGPRSLPAALGLLLLVGLGLAWRRRRGVRY